MCGCFDSRVVVIHSEDKRFSVQFAPYYFETRLYVEVVGAEFAGIVRTKGVVQRFRLPARCQTSLVTPGVIRAVIEWALDPDEQRIEVDVAGNEILKGRMGQVNAAFRAAVAEDPNNAELELVYADWLEEQELHDRAAIIRNRRR